MHPSNVRYRLMNKHIVFISGIARSGSTFFAYSLYDMFESFLAGEVMTNREIFQSQSQLKRYHSEGRGCTCGQKPEDCLYWGTILKDDNLKNEIDYYYSCLKTAEEFTGKNDAIFIDSSKSIRRLNKVARISKRLGTSLYPIHIIKHYRAQNLSVKKYSHGKSFLYKKSMTLRGHAHWIISNSCSVIYLYIAKKRGLIEDFKVIMYEDMVFEKTNLLESMAKDWIFLRKWKNSPSNKDCSYHEMGGNEGFKISQRAIKYNHKWMYESNIFSPLLWVPLEIVYRMFKSISQKEK